MQLSDAGHLMMSDTGLNEQSATTQTEQLPEATKTVVGPGAQLAAHRQARGFTIEQVANQLNLAPRQIQALEADNYAALPGIVIARGFIRAYAKLLKVDPTPLVNLMQGEAAPMESIQLKRALSGSLTESRLPSAVSNGLLSKGVLAAVLLVLVIVAIFAAYWFGLISDFSGSMSENIEKGTTFLSSPGGSTSSDHGNAVSVNAPTAPAVSSPEASSNQVTNDKIAEPIVAPPAAPAPAPAVAAAPTSVPAKTASSATPPVSAPATPAVATPAVQDNSNASNKNMLLIKVREDSWIEAKDANDKILISRLMSAGSTETLNVTKPISLTVGNVAGVDIALRGKPVDLQSATKNNVARLNLK
jgi:cytoskeleton protein RodZ